jgi:predicted nucleic-acid-binding protein
VIGLDTNILVRYLTQDDPRQAALANRLIEETLSADGPGFVARVALGELVGVLKGGYGCDRARVGGVLGGLLRPKPLVVECAEAAGQATRLFGVGRADFADCMIERAGRANSCDHTLTFDRLAAKDAGMRLLDRA